MNIVWTPIVGYEGYYEVSDHGDVRSVTRTLVSKTGKTRTYPGKPIAVQRKAQGYRGVVLQRDGVTKNHRVARLMLLSFVGEPPFEGAMALHTDDVKDNDVLTNLRWGTQSQNMGDCVRNGTHQHTRKALCDNGHVFDERNTYYRPDTGTRQCRQCTLDRNRESRGVEHKRGLYLGKGGLDYVT